ncbi:MAG: Hpt domain-containing protein [Candidatus Villigracilaceae bacterium]
MAVIDWSALDTYREVMGEDANKFIADIIKTYLTNSQTLLANLEETFRAGDVTTFHRTAHTLKSSSATVGATSVSELAAALEKATETEFPPNTETLLLDLKRACQQANAELEQSLSAAQPD